MAPVAIIRFFTFTVLLLPRQKTAIASKNVPLQLLGFSIHNSAFTVGEDGNVAYKWFRSMEVYFNQACRSNQSTLGQPVRHSDQWWCTRQFY